MSRARSGNKRERLINAAVDLFAEKGFFYTTTAEVSAQAGVAAGTLYLYFNSKDDLLVATLDTFLDEFTLNVMPAVYAAQLPADKLRAFVTEYLAFLEEHRSLARVFLVELRQNNAALRNAAGRAWERYMRVVRDLLIEVRREAGLDAVSVEALAAMILGSVEMAAVRWLLNQDARPPRAYAETLTDAALQAAGVQSVGVEIA